jgi:hypothetical protein
MTQLKNILALILLVAFLNSCSDSGLDAKSTYHIIAKPAPRWIDIRVSTSDAASTIHINNNTKSDTQKWFFIKDENGFYQIVSKDSGKCLELTKNVIHLADINNSNLQKWILLKDREGYYLIISRATGLVFDLTGASVSVGTPVGAYMSHADASQKWSIVEVK